MTTSHHIREHKLNMKTKPIDDNQIITALQSKADRYRQVLSGIEAAIAAISNGQAQPTTAAPAAGRLKLTLPRLKELLAQKSIRIAQLPSLFDVSPEQAENLVSTWLHETSDISVGKRGWLRLSAALQPDIKAEQQPMATMATH